MHPLLEGLSYSDTEIQSIPLENFRYKGKPLPIKSSSKEKRIKSKFVIPQKQIQPNSPNGIFEARILQMIVQEISKLPKFELPDLESMIKDILSKQSTPSQKEESFKKVPIEQIEGVDRLIRNVKQGIDQRWGAHGGKTSLEIPSGLINSSNKVFTLARLPHKNTDFILFKNGLKQSISNGDYTLSGLTITMTIAPTTNQDFLEVQWLR